MAHDHAPPSGGGSGANLGTAASVIVVFLLHFIEVAFPRLIRLARIPRVGAVKKIAYVADFIA